MFSNIGLIGLSNYDGIRYLEILQQIGKGIWYMLDKNRNIKSLCSNEKFANIDGCLAASIHY